MTMRWSSNLLDWKRKKFRGIHIHHSPKPGGFRVHLGHQFVAVALSAAFSGTFERDHYTIEKTSITTPLK